MKTTEARIFCGRDAEGPIIMVGGTKEKICGIDVIQYFQKPPYKEAAKHTKYVCWEGRIRTDIVPGTMLEESTEDCADLIERFFPYATIKYVTLEEVLQ